MALRTRYMENGSRDRYAYPYRTFVPPTAPIIEAEKIPIKINHVGGSLYLGWDDPEPIYCMKANPNIMTIVPLMCKPNKAAIAEMAGNFKPLPSGDVVIQAENGNNETVEIVVDADGDVVAEKKVMPNILPIALAAGAALFFLA